MNFLDLCDDLIDKIRHEVSVIHRNKELTTYNVKKKQRNQAAVLWCWPHDFPHPEGNTRQTTTLHTDGKKLFSYGWCIGHTKDEKKRVLEYTAKGLGFLSHTTSCHVGIANRHINKYV